MSFSVIGQRGFDGCARVGGTRGAAPAGAASDRRTRLVPPRGDGVGLHAVGHQPAAGRARAARWRAAGRSPRRFAAATADVRRSVVAGSRARDLVGENSRELAEAVRAGRLEAGLVALPLDDDGLEVSPAVAQFEVVYASARPEGLDGAVSIEQLGQAVLVLPEARWGDEDPTRRQLAERAQRAGINVRPRIEVQHAHAALELAARGIGDTLVTRALIYGLGYGSISPVRSLRAGPT